MPHGIEVARTGSEGKACTQVTCLSPVALTTRTPNIRVLKQQGGLGAAHDVVIGKTGDVYNSRTGERLGSLTDPNLERAR